MNYLLFRGRLLSLNMLCFSLTHVLADDLISIFFTNNALSLHLVIDPALLHFHSVIDTPLATTSWDRKRFWPCRLWSISKASQHRSRKQEEGSRKQEAGRRNKDAGTADIDHRGKCALWAGIFL